MTYQFRVVRKGFHVMEKLLLFVGNSTLSSADRRFQKRRKKKKKKKGSRNTTLSFFYEHSCSFPFVCFSIFLSLCVVVGFVVEYCFTMSFGLHLLPTSISTMTLIFSTVSLASTSIAYVCKKTASALTRSMTGQARDHKRNTTRKTEKQNRENEGKGE